MPGVLLVHETRTTSRGQRFSRRTHVIRMPLRMQGDLTQPKRVMYFFSEATVMIQRSFQQRRFALPLRVAVLTNTLHVREKLRSDARGGRRLLRFNRPWCAATAGCLRLIFVLNVLHSKFC